MADCNDPNECYSYLNETFLTVLNKYAPFKKKVARGNQAPFVKKEMRKPIYTRSSLRNDFWKIPTLKNDRQNSRK